MNINLTSPGGRIKKRASVDEQMSEWADVVEGSLSLEVPLSLPNYLQANNTHLSTEM